MSCLFYFYFLHFSCFLLICVRLPVHLVGEQDFGVLALSNHPWLISSTRNRPYFTSISFPMVFIFSIIKILQKLSLTHNQIQVSHATRLPSPISGQQGFVFISDQSMHVVTFPRNRKLNVSKFDLHAVFFPFYSIYYLLEMLTTNIYIDTTTYFIYQFSQDFSGSNTWKKARRCNGG